LFIIVAFYLELVILHWAIQNAEHFSHILCACACSTPMCDRVWQVMLCSSELLLLLLLLLQCVIVAGAASAACSSTQYSDSDAEAETSTAETRCLPSTRARFSHHCKSLPFAFRI